jgi:hypothetical protein
MPASVRAQSAPGTLRGQVTDPSGGAVAKATVVVSASDAAPNAATRTAAANRDGVYEVKDLPPGHYTVKAAAAGFAPFEKTDVVIAAGQIAHLNIALVIESQQQQVEVTDSSTRLDVSSSSNASSVVIRGKDLEALSDDPDELASDLQALAGPSAGPNGGQIYIDGFTGGQLPPKSSIREIRINQNPFSAEYDRLGYGRIEIFTKPGTDKYHGRFFLDGNDSSFNSRSPFVGGAQQPGYHSIFLDGNIGGPLSKKASFFFDIFHRSIDDLSVVNATVLDQNFNPVLFAAGVPHPRTRINLTPRLDYQLSQNNTLTLRYEYYREAETNNGVGQLSLPSLAYNELGTEQTVQVSDTQILSPRTINETRFEFQRDANSQTPQNGGSTISVNGAFSQGGNGQGSINDIQDHYEVQNYTSMALGTHFLKYGARLRATKDVNDATANFNGGFTFGAQTPFGCDPAANPAVCRSYTGLQAYQIVQKGLVAGETAAQIRSNTGLGASQFTITQGVSAIQNTYFDLGLYAQDEWRVRPSITLSYGLRFETQNQISDHADVAPRLAIAWGLGGGKNKSPKTVLRAGWGIFYDRFGQNYLLQADLLNGLNQKRYVVTNPDFYPNLPTPAELAAAVTSPTVYQIAPNLRAPYTMQTGVSLERQLGKFANIAVTYLGSRGLHQFLTRNINAPLALSGPPTPGCALPDRPFCSAENIYQYESSGVFKQNEMRVNGTVRVGTALSLFGWYVLNDAQANTGGASSFPSNQYNIQQDYGRTAYDVRHRLLLGGTIGAPYGFRFSPFLVASSGIPFNITTGQDLNGDSIFNDRPAFAGSLSNPANVVVTKFGSFDTRPVPGETIIPINYGTSDPRVSLNLRVSKTFGFGPRKEESATLGGPGGSTFGRPNAGGHGHWFGGGSSGYKYDLTFGVSARNIFNRVNTGTPIGVLSSPLFGQPNSLAEGPYSSGAANRRLDLQVSFSF